MSDLFDPKTLNPQALEVLKDPHRFQVLNWHRKARKTTLAINQLIRWASAVEAPFWYVGPSYGLAKDTIWNDPHMLPHYIPEWDNPKSNYIKKSETELRVNFRSKGQIYIYGSDRPDLMRGPNPMGVVLDEFSVQKPEVWEEVVQPIMRSNPHAWCWFLFTPRGRNHAFTIYNKGTNPEASDWKSWKMNIYESGVLTPEQIEEAKNDMLASTFQQEYMCEFLEGEGQVFRGVKEITTATPREPIQGHLYVMGVDLGRLKDYTVVTVFDRATNYQVYQDRFKTIEWPFQKAKIIEISRHYNNCLSILDATGIGDPIADDLIRAGVPIEPYKITEPSKKALIEKLSIWIEQKKTRILNLPETVFELENFSFIMGPTGRVKYSAPEGEGFHDDIVLSLALGVWGLSPLNRAVKDRLLTPLEQYKENLISQIHHEEEDWGFDN